MLTAIDWRTPLDTTVNNDKSLERLVTHFPTYLAYVYSHIGLPDPTPLQYRIAELLTDNPDRMILQAARGVGKSWIIAIYVTYRLLRNVDEKVLLLSASGPKAQEIATFIRSLFEQIPLLQHLKPGSDDRDSILSFDVAGSKVSIAPSVSCLGVTSQITGKRASLVVADDIEVPSNSATEVLREKLINRVQELEALLIPDMPSSILFAGTPQSLESIYGKIDYFTTILPAQVPDNEDVYLGKLDPWILLQGKPGDPTDKVRFPEEVLAQKLAGMGKPGYKLQFMLDTTLSDAERFPLKAKDFICMPCDLLEAPATIRYTGSKDHMLKDIPNFGFTGDRLHGPYHTSDTHMKYDKIIMSIDPSGSGLDETSFAVIGVLSGNAYVLDFGGTRKGYSDEAMVFLANKAKEWQVNEIVPERNFGSGLFTELFKKMLINVYSCYVVDDFTVKGQKEARIIDNIAPILTNHQLVINQEAVEREAEWIQKDPATNLVYGLMYQLTHITYDKGSLVHDDRLDALAIGLQYISDMVIVSDTKRLELIKEKELDEWLHDKVYSTKLNPHSNTIIGQYKSVKRNRL